MRFYVGLVRGDRVVWWITWCISLQAARNLAGHWLTVHPTDSLTIQTERRSKCRPSDMP